MILSFSDFTTKLARGQLKNLAAVDDAQEGLLLPEYEDQVLELTNQGLIDISTKKKLFEETQTLTLVDGQNIYPLDTSEGGGYFNMVRVLDIVTKDERKHTPKSNVHINMPNLETLRFSTQWMNLYKPEVDVRFQVRHPSIGLEDDMNLPSHLYEALLLYVSGLYLSHMGGEEHSKKGDSYYGLYLKMMTEDTIENLSSTSENVDEDTRFHDRGFV